MGRVAGLAHLEDAAGGHTFEFSAAQTELARGERDVSQDLVRLYKALGDGCGHDTARAQVTPSPWPILSRSNAMNDPFKTHGAFSWCELMTPDPEAAKRFYGTLFGWTLEDMDWAGEPIPSSRWAARASAAS
jgi:hypothetical protein